MFFIFRVCCCRCCRCISIVCYSVWVYTVHIGRLPNKHADCRACLCNIVDQKKKMLSGVLWASVPVFPPLVICVRLCSYPCIHPKSNVSKTFNHTGHHTNLNCAVVEINGKCAGSTDDIDSYHGSTRFNIERDSSKTIRPHMSVYKWCTWKMSQLQLHTARNFTRNLKLFKNCAKYICCASSRK